MSDAYVLDASAVLALLNEEPGADRVASVLDQASICSVNKTEVLTRLLDWGLTQSEANEAFQALELAEKPFDGELAEMAAWLRPLTRQFGLSLGDRACLALGQKQNAHILTTDRPWQNLEIGVSIECVRPKT